MSLHEKNKQRNRERILTAADAIIREQGLESLSMRYLAEYAGVSLRTPYNLFGSKTEILGELLKNMLARLLIPLSPVPETGGVGALLGLIDILKRAQPSLDGRLRELLWSIMTAPEQSLRDTGIEWITARVEPLVEKAVIEGELQAVKAPAQLARHLVIMLLAVFGMWGGGQLEVAEAIRQVDQAWCACLLVHSSETLAQILKNRLEGE